MRVRWRIWVPVVAILLMTALGWLGLAMFDRALVGPRHEFDLVERPPFLTEQLAIAKAREALALDVPDPDAWVLAPDGRTTAPNGCRDEFLSRNGINPNQGSVVFRGPGSQSRCVSVELVGDRVVCQSARGK
jgi:hypothetical protein